MTDLPPGTPAGEHDAPHLAAVWCQCGTRWSPTPAGYLPDMPDDAHPGDIPVQTAGLIPCGPATPYDPADYPNAGPAAVRAVLDEMGLTPEDLDP